VNTGATRAEHIESNAGAAEVELTDDVLDELEELFPR